MINRSFFFAFQWILLALLLNPIFLSFLFPAFTTYDLQRITELLLLISMSLHLCLDNEFRAQSIQFIENLCTSKKALLFLLLLLGAISSLAARYSLYAFMEIATFILLFIFACSIAGWYALKGQQFLRDFGSFLICCLTLNAFTALIALVFAVNNPQVLGASFSFLPSPGYMNPRFFDDAQVFLIPLLISFFCLTPNKGIKALIFALIAFSFARGILDGSRIYFYAPLLSFVVLLILFRKKALPFLGVLCCGIVVGFILYFLLYHWALSHISATATYTSSQFGLARWSNMGLTGMDNRLLLWHIALHLIKFHLFLGVGPLHFGVYAFPIENTAAHPHSALLVLAAEWGLPALAIVLILAISSFWQFVKTVNQLDPPYLVMGVLSALMGGGLMATIDGLILMPPGQIMLAVTLGLAFYLFYGKQNKEILSLASASFASCIMGIVVISVATLLFAALPLIFGLPELTMRYLTSCNFTCIVSPDYWAQGFIQFY